MDLLDKIKVELTEDGLERHLSVSAMYSKKELQDFMTHITKTCPDAQAAASLFYTQLTKKQRRSAALGFQIVSAYTDTPLDAKIAMKALDMMFYLCLTYPCLIADEFNESTSSELIGRYMTEQEFEELHEEAHSLLALKERIEEVPSDTIIGGSIKLN